MAKRPVGLATAASPQAIVLAAFLLFGGITALGGGSARPDVAALIPVRLSAIFLIAVVLLAVPADRLARARATMVFSVAAAVLVALQLVPLPPALWSALPGRARFAFDAVAGLEPQWRPLSVTPDLTLNTFLSLLPPTAAALWAQISGKSGRVVALYALIGIGLTSAALGLLQMGAGPETVLRYYPITNSSAAVGMFANRNHNALLLAIAISPLALWAGLGGHDGRPAAIAKTWLALGGAIFLVTSAAITGSRAGLILAFATSALSALIYWRLRRQWPAARRGAVATIAARWLPAIGVVIVILVSALLTQTRAFTRLLETDPLDEQRAQWIKPLSEMAWNFAPVGAGFGSFDSIFRGFEPFEMLQTTYLNAAHNDLLQLAIEGGIGGIGLLAIFLWWWGKRAIAAWRMPIDTRSTAFARVGSVVTGTAMIASLVDYPLRTPLLAVVFAIACCWMGDTAETKARRGQDQDAFTGTA